MKNRSTLTSGLVAALVGLTFVFSAAAQNVTQLKAKVVRISGHARFTTGNNVWQPLKVGDTLRAGTVIQTDSQKGSYVDLVLGDASGVIVAPSSPSVMALPMKNSYAPRSEQNVVRVWENSALGIDKLTTMDTGADNVTETQLDLKAGHIMGTVKKLSAASKYEVKIPNGVAGIRGSLYELWANGLLKVNVGLGVLAWVGGDGNVNSKEVPGGSQFDPATGETSSIGAADRDNMRAFETSIHGNGGGRGAGEGGDRGRDRDHDHDHTIYHVSPFHHHHNHGHGGGGDDQGEDEG
jgi:hypothetical protein